MLRSGLLPCSFIINVKYPKLFYSYFSKGVSQKLILEPKGTVEFMLLKYFITIGMDFA